MKLIFLDIDGVLVNRASTRLPRTPLEGRDVTASTAHPSCVEQLNRVTDATSAKFVISSVWRGLGVKTMRELFTKWGVKGKIVGRTPDLSRRNRNSKIYVAVERGEEIQAWLALHSRMRWPTEPFVIIDDNADMNGLSDRLVRTEFESGLTAGDAERAIAMLSTEVN